MLFTTYIVGGRYLMKSIHTKKDHFKKKNHPMCNVQYGTYKNIVGVRFYFICFKADDRAGRFYLSCKKSDFELTKNQFHLEFLQCVCQIIAT